MSAFGSSLNTEIIAIPVNNIPKYNDFLPNFSSEGGLKPRNTAATLILDAFIAGSTPVIWEMINPAANAQINVD